MEVPSLGRNILITAQVFMELSMSKVVGGEGGKVIMKNILNPSLAQISCEK